MASEKEPEKEMGPPAGPHPENLANTLRATKLDQPTAMAQALLAALAAAQAERGRP
jgi:hypothetical protein